MLDKIFKYKSILMIHEFKEEYLQLPLENYVLSFDDGLLSPFNYLDILYELNTPIFFNISSGIICPNEVDQDWSFITAHNAHKKAFNGNFENYLNLEQIKFIKNYDNCFIAGHGHSHIKDCDKLEDTKKMFEWFLKNLNMKPVIFCFPYNIENKEYKEILKSFGVKSFIGKNRVDIKELL